MQDPHEPNARPAENRRQGDTLPARSPSGTRRVAVSVIIPTYNRAHLLGEALNSVRQQSFQDYEIIVVDDGSEDDTHRLVASHTMPIRYIYQENQGVARARNRAIEAATGELLAFLDSDDLWEPAFLERTVQRLRTHPDEALAYTDFVSIDRSGQPLRGHRKKPYGGDVTRHLFASIFIHTSAVVVCRQAVLDAGGFDPNLSHNEDYDLWLRLSLRHRFGLVPEPLCRRRCHPESLSRNGCSPGVLLDKARLLQRFYEHGGGRSKIDLHTAHKRLGKLYYSAAKAFLKAGRPHEAAPLFREAIRFDPARPRVWFWLGLGDLARVVRRADNQP